MFYFQEQRLIKSTEGFEVLMAASMKIAAYWVVVLITLTMEAIPLKLQ
jgi:hypothetical protein